MKLSALLPVVIGLTVPAGAETAFPEEDVAFFKESVRPLLGEHCIRCHGGEKGGKVKIRSGLQLISRKGIVNGGEHGSAYDPASPEESLLLHVLNYGDENLQMPPKGKLDDASIAVLTDWVQRGMPWTPEDADRLVEVEEEHSDNTTINEHTKSWWSYRPMVRPEIPEVDNNEWGGAIDAFIFDGLRGVGLLPNGPASRGELIRRAYYDITGLPPSLEEVQAFAADPDPGAWEKLVDQLLASPGYGEKWGRHWLDVVRYAETNGFERDGDKAHIWRYRDYVINAFNSDKPYDQFLREQLAGDEAPDASLESITATGYHYLMQWDDEPADRKQHYYDGLDDNVRTTTEGILGMTVGCARCHDHKGDPISQIDYYSFMSFFRGLNPMTKEGGAVERIRIEGTEDGFAEAVERHRNKQGELEARLAKVDKEILAKIAEKDAGLVASLEGLPGSLESLIPGATPGGGSSWYSTEEPPEDGWSDVGFRAGSSGWSKGGGGFGSRGTERFFQTPWDAEEIWLQTSFLLEEVPNQVRVKLAVEGRASLYLNGRRVNWKKGQETWFDPEQLGFLQTGRNVLTAHVKRSDVGGYFDIALDAAHTRPPDRAEVIAKALDFGVGSAIVNRRAGIERSLLKHGRSHPEPGIPVMAASESAVDVPPTYVHIRGSAHAEDEDRRVVPATPSIFGGEVLAPASLPDGTESSGRRTALARWITRDDNPRTARVIMNRVWQHHFGRGICPTPNDFGFLGEEPTHPELLDWLATELVAQGWSLKAMHKKIMLSRAYQMSSRGDPEGLLKDPDNNQYWRFDMRRLTAEEVRDSILELTGELNRKMGGPSIYIPLPKEVLATSSKKDAVWGESPEEDTLRRSVYVKVKRSLVPPQFADLDAADTDASCPVRFTTTVPTQALGFLNSGFMNQQAQVFSGRLLREAGPEREDRVRMGLELALSRTVRDSEVEAGIALLEKMRTAHGLDRETALERFALLVLNLNEFVFLD